MRLARSIIVSGLGLLAAGFWASAQTPIAVVPVDDARDGGVKVAGAIEVSNGHAIISSGGSITAGDRTADILLPGKGELHLCATTTVHLSRSGVPGAASGPATASGPAVSGSPPSGPLMIALDRGALEANYVTGQYSDVLMTPDFRILISGPGQADLRIRVSPQGDTCVENCGEHAPYVTVSSQLEEGLYRVQSGQRVLFEHGSLREVVDHEEEPCGCPAPPLAVASTGTGGAGAPQKGAPFPLAESEGLAPVPQPTAQAALPPGTVQTQITVPLTYNGAAPPPVVAAPVAPAAAVSSTAAAPTVAAQPARAAPSKGVFHRMGRFFSHLFGK
jgi:hypothetical protein